MQLLSTTDAEAKGTRDYMEDQNFVAIRPEGTLLAVFDGHGGHQASVHAWAHFARFFWASLAFFQEQFFSPEQATRALRDSIKQLTIELSEYEAGTTLSAVFIPTEGDNVYTAVLGDSPILIKTETLVWNGPDHNIRSNPAEREAAEARGGYCDGAYLFRSMDGMGLQMGRALGDANLQGVLSTEPEINTVPIVGHGFILVATDGLFDPTHHSFEKSKAMVLSLITAGADAEDLVDNAVERDTHDNATAILARF